jgi:glycosyltransferase involved in cell wall biosynthesis
MKIETWKLIRQGEAGLWVPPEDPAKLAETILILKEEKALCERLGKRTNLVRTAPFTQYATEQFEKLFLRQ